MPRVKTKPERIVASLLEIQDKPELYLEQTVWVRTDELLDAHHPENPRIHEMEGDIPEIFKSLLWFGWAVNGITFNPETGRLTGGHGRSMAADMGRKISPEEYEVRFERWLKEDPARESLKSVAGVRFTPEYWEYCPVYVCLLTQIDQKTLMVRLNNQNKDGRDDPARMAAILGQLPKGSTKDAGWDLQTAEAFKSAFLQRLPDPEPEPDEPGGYQFDEGLESEGGTEREYGQTFERPDATDYGDDDDEEDFWGADTTAESGPVITGEDGEVYEVITEDGDIEDKDAKNVFKHSGGHYSDTRFILYVSNEQNDQYKEYCKVAADALGVDRVGEIAKIWRTQATFAVMDWFFKNHLQAAALWAEHQAAQLEAENLTDDADPESTAD